MALMDFGIDPDYRTGGRNAQDNITRGGGTNG